MEGREEWIDKGWIEEGMDKRRDGWIKGGMDGGRRARVDKRRDG